MSADGKRADFLLLSIPQKMAVKVKKKYNRANKTENIKGLSVPQTDNSIDTPRIY